jgi:hypothetical protein
MILTWESGLGVIDRVPTGSDEPSHAPSVSIIVVVGRVVVGRVRAVDDGRRLGVGVRSHGFDFV